MQYSSFPLEGVTGTSVEYNLDLIEIPSHLDRECMYKLDTLPFNGIPELSPYCFTLVVTPPSVSQLTS